MREFFTLPSKYFFVLIICLFLSACGGGKSSNTDSTTPDTITPVVEDQITKTITINVLDVDGTNFTQNVTVNLSGADVVDTNQNSITSIIYPATKTFQAKIAPNTNVDLKLLSNTNNYVDSGVTLQLEPDVSDYSTTLYLVPNVSGSAKAGIYTEVSSISEVSNGEALNDITLSLEESASTPKLSISIPKGTQFTDGNGNSITPDSSTLVRYDPTEAGVLDAYPGGLNVMADIDGTMEQVNFKSAGFASIVLQNAEGGKVKKFDQDITIAMQFKIGITDNTGKVAEVNDIVPIWSFDEDDGSWKFERNGTVKDLDLTDGLYDVTYKTDHLTFYNLDWDIENVCNANIKVENTNGTVQTERFDVEFVMSAFNLRESISYLGDGVITLLNAPTIPTPWVLIFRDTDSAEEVGRYSSIETICNDNIAIIGTTAIEDNADNIEVYSVEAIATSGGTDCDIRYSGSINVTNGTDIVGNVQGLPIEGTRNTSNGEVTFGLVGDASTTIATFGGTINSGQANGTWSQTGGVCSGSWSGTLL